MIFLLINVLLIGGISCQTWPTFHLYNRAGVGTQVTAATLARLKNIWLFMIRIILISYVNNHLFLYNSAPGYDPTKEIKLVIHGFSSSQYSSSVTIIRDALLSKVCIYSDCH